MSSAIQQICRNSNKKTNSHAKPYASCHDLRLHQAYADSKQIRDIKQNHHLASEGPSAKWILSGCCNLTRYDHPPTASRQKSSAVDLEGYLPYLESWPSRCLWCQKPRHLG